MRVVDTVVVNDAVDRSENMNQIAFKQCDIEMGDHGGKPPKYGGWLVVPICLGGTLSRNAMT